ncbi:MAG: hypothetical protein RL088_3442 [Verrucomicrobiota bacterium]|jgi:hypothetical protein
MQSKSAPAEGQNSAQKKDVGQVDPATSCCASSEGERKYASELQELCDMIMGGKNVPAPFREVKEKLEITLKYRTSKRINYATDSWGGQDETHLEIDWRGRSLMIDINEDRIHVVGPCFEVDKHSMNAMDITPHLFRHNGQGLRTVTPERSKV